MIRKFWWVIAAAAVLALSGCGNGATEAGHDHAEEHGEEASSEATISPDKAKIGGIKTEETRMMPIQAEIKVAGTVTSVAQGRALVTPPVSGKILRLLVSPGEKVRQGQGLAVLESPELADAASEAAAAERERITAEAAVKRAGSELELAKAKARSADAQLTRQRSLARTGAFSQPGVHAAQNEVSEAQAELEAAKEDEAVHRIQLERAERLYRQELISRTELEQAQLAVTQDQVKRKRAEERLATATSALNRERDIAKQGLLNAREIQTAEADTRAAKLEVQRSQIEVQSEKSHLESAKKAIANAQTHLAASRGSGNSGSGATITLAAPIAGTVTEVKATVGQAVERASELFEIENLDTVWVTANVPEKMVEAIRTGLRVRVTAAAYPGKEFAGVVQLLGNHLDAKTRTMPVQCLVQNRRGLLREDMFATVLLSVGAATSALAVPDTAIDRHTDEAAVFVATGDNYEKRVIETGRTSGGYTEVLSGLKAGERVVTEGMFIVESETRKGELKGHDH